ncbi:hypothetical protein GGR57DRAFT_268590 [Xylariaceae sp. FL1272]|nr:hypothetical protein GGR57DRAFT_268590 [Xylariaceae sp. FL1272]
MIPILCRVYDSSGRLSRGTRVFLRYGGAAWYASTSSRGVIEIWYFDKVVAEDMDVKCSVTTKQEESYGHSLVTHYFSASRTEIHLIILCLGSSCCNPSFRLISRPLGSTHALLIRSSVCTQGAAPLLTIVNKVKNKQLSQGDTETSQTLSFGSGGSFSISPFQERAVSSSAATSIVPGGFSGLSGRSSNLMAGNQPRSGNTAASSPSAGFIGSGGTSNLVSDSASSGGFVGSGDSSDLPTRGQPRASDAMASTLSGGGRFGLTSSE